MKEKKIQKSKLRPWKIFFFILYYFGTTFYPHFDTNLDLYRSNQINDKILDEDIPDIANNLKSTRLRAYK